MAEEEREGLTDFRRRVSLPERHELAVAFAAFEARNFAGVRPVDKDPEDYVRAAGSGRAGGRGERRAAGPQRCRARAGSAAAAGAPGSLGIGDLKGG